MFFPISAEETSKALGQIRRLRHSGNWKRVGASDAYWNAPFLAALVDAVDNSLLEKPLLAFELSTECIRLAERMRQESCPSGSEVGKRSLIAWAYAVHGSSCRALERYPEAEAAFQIGRGLVGRRVLEWAAAEVWRRYAALLLSQGSLASLDFANKALDLYAGFPSSQADALVVRGLIHLYLESDFSAAAKDMGKALDLVEAKRSPREARTWSAALHNLGLVYTRGPSDLPTLEATLKRLRRSVSNLTKHEPYRRVLCLWIEALLLVPLGLSRRSETLLNRARKWFEEHEHFHQAALCAVDLALIYFQDGDEASGCRVLAAVPPLLISVGSPLLALPEHRLALENPCDIRKESLAALREALAAFAANGKGSTQPFGTIAGPTPSSSPAAQDPLLSAAED